MESIAICITTRNRPKLLQKSAVEWITKKPKNAKLIIVDDASDNPAFGFDYYFKNKTKNDNIK